jgi:hypothetical protein
MRQSIAMLVWSGLAFGIGTLTHGCELRDEGSISSPEVNGGTGGMPVATGGEQPHGGSGDVASGGTAPSGNLIGNPDFESGTSGWRVLGGGVTTQISVSSAEAFAGQQSLIVTGREEDFQGPVYALTGQVAPNASYRVSVWVRLADYPTSATANVTLRTSCDSEYTYTSWVFEAPVSANAWTELAGTNVTPDCSRGYSEVDLYIEAPAHVLSFYIDEVYFAAA